MKRLFSILTILTLNSCSIFKENGIEMRINNNSNEPITNVEFTTTEKLEVIKINRIEPNERVIKFLSMQKNRTDGAYTLTFNRANEKKEICSGGYYTNGGALDNWVDFIVDNDTIIVKFEAPIY